MNSVVKPRLRNVNNSLTNIEIAMKSKRKRITQSPVTYLVDTCEEIGSLQWNGMTAQQYQTGKESE